MNLKEKFNLEHPNSFYLENDLETVNNYLLANNWLYEDEVVLDLEIPGEGNMNFVIRVKTNKRSFIVKQSRPFVQKYPQIEAPTERIIAEADYIKAISGIDALKRFTPEIVGFDESIRYDVALAVHEALSNAIVHGNDSVASKPVNVEFQVGSEQSLKVKVRDQGEGFRVEDIPDPTAPANLLRPNGRGVFYIRKLMDEVDFSHTDRHGGELVMVKKANRG